MVSGSKYQALLDRLNRPESDNPSLANLFSPVRCGQKDESIGTTGTGCESILQHIDTHPEVLCTINVGIVGCLYAQIEGVEVDLNQRLLTEFDDVGMP